ncbi:MAG: class F sortase [Acidimicrobiia bacterium]|nr:class F sortase [Acidimicrobiia bacterium]
MVRRVVLVVAAVAAGAFGVAAATTADVAPPLVIEDGGDASALRSEEQTERPEDTAEQQVRSEEKVEDEYVVPPPEEPAAVAAARAPVDARPLRVRIERIGVDAGVVDLGLNDDGTLEVPKDFGITGWYTGRSVPGEEGPSVVVGHVDSQSGPAVFYRLRDLRVGDVIEVDRSDGLTALFRVTESILVDKDEFPTDRVYGATDAPVIRLITCGGDFDKSERSYVGNLIVLGEHIGNSDPQQRGADLGASIPG